MNVCQEDSPKVIPNVLTREQCIDWITRIESSGDVDEEEGVGSSQYARYNFRDIKLSTLVWSIIKEEIKEFDSTVKQLSIKWYASKYWPETSFIAPHYDGNETFDDFISKYTVIIYLNDNFGNGEIVFLYDDDKELKIKPQTGAAVIMKQNVLHKGNPPISNFKYILRADLLVKR